MPSLSVRIDSEDIGRLNRRVGALLQAVSHLEPIMAQGAEYMKNSTVNRILRTKMSPQGERWAALSDVTVRIKGHDSPLFHTGELAGSVNVKQADDHGFMISADAPYASYMQNGVKAKTKSKSRSRSKAVKMRTPARPFMGFSNENVRRITRMIKDYISNGGGQ